MARCEGSRRRRRRHYLGLVPILFVAACSDVRNSPDLAPTDVFGTVGRMDLSARAPLRTEGVRSTAVGSAASSATYYGNPVEAANPTIYPGDGPNVTPGGGDTYQLSFDNVPIAAVVKATLGDILGLGYSIDPRVQGNMSLSSGRPLPKAEILFALESALRLSNAALVRQGSSYNVVMSTDAVGAAGVDRAGTAEPGFGLSVLALRYVSGTTILKLMDSFAAKPGAIRVEPTRNLLLISGTGPERQAALDTALAFDADWMRGQSVGIFPLRNAPPETMIGELDNIMQTADNGPNQGLIKFQPVERLNAVMVVAKGRDLLQKAATWIARLDRTDASASDVKVYRVRYGDAKLLADLLNQTFSGQAPASDAASQLAPGTTTQTSRSVTIGANPAAAGAQPYGTLTASVRQTSRSVEPAAADLANTANPSTPLLAGVHVTADSTHNSLLIYASRENYKIVERTLQLLDRPQLQVAIEATIAEVTLNNSLQYGVQYFLKSNDLGLGRNKGSVGLSTGTALSGAISRALPGANLVLGQDADPRIVLDALRTYTDVKVISSPSVVVLDNQVASLQVGDSVPVATSEATLVSATSSTSQAAPGGSLPVANTIDYRNTGIILRVLPRINANGNVTLDIEQEISNVVENANSGTLTPTVSERKIKSAIAVASGQTVMLGGLISESQNTNRSGVPLLERIQGLGDLFSDNGRTATRTELIIFIRPRIIRDAVDAQSVAEQLRSKILSSAPSGAYLPEPTIIRKD